MKIKVADYLIEQLERLGIEEIFGLPGDYNFKLVEAVEKNKKVNWIGSTNELNAGYAADGYARIKGCGALITTFGVGELSAINAIAGCMAENVPVIKITGVPSSKDIKNKTLLHHNLDKVNYYAFKNAYSNVVEACAFLTKENAKKEIDRLLNVMIKTKHPVYIAIPMDVAILEIENNPCKFIETKSNPKNLNNAVNRIIKEIKKAQKPVFALDVLIKRFGAKNIINNFLSKTKIPSFSFIRGIDIVDNEMENYMGVFSGGVYNKICKDYLDNSDCIILAGAVLSDLTTMNFSYNFNIKDTINIQPNFVNIKGKKFSNVIMKDLIEELFKKLDYISKEDIKGEFGYEKIKAEKNKNLDLSYFYPKLNEFIKENDILVSEVGLVPFGISPMKFPKNIIVENQLLWGSIGWATPCAEGCALADKTKRVIMVTGDGAHQLTAQEISTMMRNKLKPVIFVINNSGYTVERILCDDINFKYNDIASWNYSKLPEVFKGDCYCANVKTENELDEVFKQIEQNSDKMCYIELHTEFLDVPPLAKGIVKK